MKLSYLPKTFDLHEGVEKGFFAHLFNKKENQNYIGKYPDAHYYAVDSMSREERDTFLNWYEEVGTLEFNFKTEIRKYCIQDVNIQDI